MILYDIFEEFIYVVQENDRYTIGLLDDDGQIISCSNKKLIGKKLSLVSENKNDTIHRISIRNVDYGYLWVNGNDDDLKMISSLFLESLTTRLMYEINTTSLKQKVTKDDKLVRLLIDDHEFDKNQVLKLIHELNIDENLPRIAILILHPEGFDVDEIVRLKLRTDSSELIYSSIDKQSILMFKDIPVNVENHEIKSYLTKYIDDLKLWGLVDCDFLVGTPQNRLRYYETSYKNCLWLKRNVARPKQDVTFFVENFFGYFLSQIDMKEIRRTFKCYQERSKEVDVSEMIHIADCLIKSNFNISQAADELFLHKNTLIYKLKKYEEVFDIDIRGSFQGKVLLSLIAYAFLEYQQQLQVGEKV